MKASSLAILAAAALCAPTIAAAADLTVEIQGVSEARGTVLVAVYDKAETWLRRPMRATRLQATSGTIVASLAGLPEGAYAVSLYHDENGNGRLDTNEMRIPIEPWGFSNDAIGHFGPASFEDARFTLPAEGARIVVQLRS